MNTETVLRAGEGQRPRVVVVGAGFGGLSAIHALAHQDVDVLLVDRNNYHGFWPLLYQVATAGLEPEAIAYPVRGLVRGYPNVDFQLAEVTGVDFKRRLVLSDGAPIAYDYLILAAGSANNYFGNHGLQQQTFGMKDIDDAEALRNHVLLAFELATREPDPARRAALLTFVIVGGGPTGVELAGALSELIQNVLRKDYRLLDCDQAQVVLIESHSELLKTFPAGLQEAARRRLEKMGVEVRLGTALSAVDGDLVLLRGGESLRADTVIWAAGVRAALLSDALNLERGRGARVVVTPELHVPEQPEVFIVGDMAHLANGDDAYPMVAPVAIQMGRQAAQNILAAAQGQPAQPFRYHDKGQMATIGRKAAVLSAFGLQVSGLLAWVGWLVVHLSELVGMRNRVVVLTNWVYNYLTYERGVRLITGMRVRTRKAAALPEVV